MRNASLMTLACLAKRGERADLRNASLMTLARLAKRGESRSAQCVAQDTPSPRKGRGRG